MISTVMCTPRSRTFSTVCNLLTQRGEVIKVPASQETFVASMHLRCNPGSETMLPILFMSEEFMRRFYLKNEKPIGETEMVSFRLQQNEADNLSIKIVDVGEKAEVTLREMLYFLGFADRTEWFIFCVRDIDDILLPVSVFWYTNVYGSGWSFDIDSVIESDERKELKLLVLRL